MSCHSGTSPSEARCDRQKTQPRSLYPRPRTQTLSSLELDCTLSERTSSLNRRLYSPIFSASFLRHFRYAVNRCAVLRVYS
jgi:hypothetical protein